MGLFSFFFVFFGHATWLVEYQIPDWGLSLDHSNESLNSNQ